MRMRAMWAWREHRNGPAKEDLFWSTMKLLKLEHRIHFNVSINGGTLVSRNTQVAMLKLLWKVQEKAWRE
jgi:hypothetical protein